MSTTYEPMNSCMLLNAGSMESDDSATDRQSEMVLNSHIKLDLDQPELEMLWRSRAEIAERQVARLSAELTEARHLIDAKYGHSPDNQNNKSWIKWLSSGRQSGNNAIVDKVVDWQQEARRSADQVLSLQQDVSDLKAQLMVVQQQLKDTQAKLDDTTLQLQGQLAATEAAHREANQERMLKEQRSGMVSDLQQKNRGLEAQLQQLRELLMLTQRHSDNVMSDYPAVRGAGGALSSLAARETDVRIMHEEAELRRLYNQLELVQQQQNWLQKQTSIHA